MSARSSFDNAPGSECDDRVMHSLKRLSCRMDHIKQVASGPFKYSSLLNTYAMSLFSTQNGTAFSCPTLSSGSALQPPCGDSSSTSRRSMYKQY